MFDLYPATPVDPLEALIQDRLRDAADPTAPAPSASLPADSDDPLADLIAKHSGPDMQQDRGVPQFDYISFMDKMIDEHNANGLQDATNGRISPTKKVNGYH